MFKMFNQFFAMLSTLFSAGERGAKALDHLAAWSEETAGAFADEARIARRAKLNAMQMEAGLLPAPVVAEAE